MIQPATRRMRVLVVEDHEHMGEVLVEMIDYFGHEAWHLRDGAAALALWAEPAAPHAAFIDLGLPRVDGYEVARRLRAAGERAWLVAVTGSLEADVPRRCRDAGFDQTLIKPVRLDQVGRVLRQVGALVVS